MMCSSWKISVFGIVALMLAFGLVTTDAEAQALANHSAVTVAVTADTPTGATGPEFRAAQTNRIVTFTVTLVSEGGADAAGIDQAGIIEIQIPSGQGWSSPRRVADTTDLALAATPAGSVTYASTHAGITADKVTAGNWKLTVNVPETNAGTFGDETITLRYKTNVPVMARNSNFRIISRVHKDDGPHLAVARTGAGTDTDPFIYTNPGFTGSTPALVNGKAIYEARGHYIVLVVGSAPSGTGTFALTTTGIDKGADDYKADGPPAYNHAGKYLVTAEKQYNLVFTYTAAGTMHKGSVIRFTIPQDDGIDAGEDWPLLTDGTGAGKLVVSGATLFSFERVTPARTTAAAFLSSRVEKGHRVTFTYMDAKTPKVTATSDAVLSPDGGYVFMAHTISPTGSDDDITLANAAADAPAVGGAVAVSPTVTFLVVQGQGGGGLDVASTSGHGKNIPVSTGDSAAADLVLTYTAAGRMLQGSQVTFSVPPGWTPAPRTSQVSGSPIDSTVSAVGTSADAQTIALGVAVVNRLVTITLNAGELLSADTITITYSGVKQPPTGGVNEFRASSSSYKGETLKALPDGKFPVINVVAGDGSGAIVLMKDDQRFGRTKRATKIPELEFVYTPAGHLPVGTKLQIVIPAGWTPPQAQNNDGTVDAGELSITPADRVTLELPSGQTVTARTTKVLAKTNPVTITYGNVTVPDVDPRSDVFTTRLDTVPESTDATAISSVDPAALISPSPTVGIDQAADGAGTMTVNMTQVNAGDPIGDLVFTYTAAGNMAFGAKVQLKIDADWPKAIADDGTNKQGMTTVSGRRGDPELAITDDGRTVTATLNGAIVKSDTLVFTYKNITAPNVAGMHTFTASSQHTSTGVLTVLQESPTIDVRVRAAGTVDLAVKVDETTTAPLPAIEPNDELGDLQFTFTAGARMENGSQVVIVIPAGWTRASEDNGDAVTIPGEVALKETDPATLEVTINADGSYTLTATTTDALLADGTLTFTYQDVTAHAQEGTYTFASSVSAVAGGTPLPIDNSPMVTVRTKPTSLTLTTSANTFFVNDSITVTVTLDASAPVGGLDVALTTDPADMGMFSLTEGGDAVTTVRIADAATSAMVYYTSGTPGAVTLMGMSGDDLSGSVPVTAKSTISNLKVNGQASPDPVLMSSTIRVTATGKEGKATVAIAPMAPADGDGTTPDDVVTPKGLDVVDPTPEGTPEGDVAYTRDITLPGLDDGLYTVTVYIADDELPIVIEVIDDQDPPMLSEAAATPVGATEAANGGQVALSVKVATNASGVAVSKVEADVSALDSTRAEMPVMLTDDDEDGIYTAIFTISADNMASDGMKMVSFTATDRVGNESEAATASITLRNNPVLSDATITPGSAVNGDMVTISVNGDQSGLTVTADASAIGGAADEMLEEGMDDDMMGTGMYSVEVEVTGAAGGDQMVSITGADSDGNESEAVTASVSIHAVTAVSFTPAEVSSGDTVMVSAMGNAGMTGSTFDVFDADGTKIVTDGSLTEDDMNPGSYSGSFDVVVDAHPPGEYWVSATIGQATGTAEGALTIDHMAQFELSIGAGTHLIHVPLNVTHINGMPGTINNVGELYDALGDAVNFIISLGADGSWMSYLGDTSKGGAADADIGDDTGLIAVMSSAASLMLSGEALGMGGVSTINLREGNNLVGVPLAGDPKLPMISSALALPGISAVVVSNSAGAGFNTITRAGDPGDGPLMGGVGYIVVASAAGMVPIVGTAWDNSMTADMGDGMTAGDGMNGDMNGAAATAPSIGVQTPVLQVQGKLIDQAGMMSRDGLNVTVRNLTRGTTLGNTIASDDYSMTFVKLDSSAAKVGDVLEIKADSPNPLLGIRPVQHVVTADDVRDSRIDLPDLVTYEIPARSELLANYPNPFNPETWIPFRLAKDSNVSVSIYGASGSLVRTIDIGFTPAAVYEGRSDAIYWDGRNDFGEQVSSGLYFYHLSAGEFSATRRMVIVK